jgi:fumarate hydratase class II
MAILKKRVHCQIFILINLAKKKCELIVKVCDEIVDGKLDEHFPLHVWQTGSGTHTNMNLNEVISNRAYQIDTSFKLHPNDDVNMSQSSNDTFPTSMRIAVLGVYGELLESLNILKASLTKKQNDFRGVKKVGRTHLQDAVSIDFGDEISGYCEMLIQNEKQILEALKYITPLPIGATAVGNGINSPESFDKQVCHELNKLLDFGVKPMPNKYYGLTSHDAEVFLSGALNSLAANLTKIANDFRWLGSGPNCSIGEIKFPANEPGSSIMPAKVNPTQAEAIIMIAAQVMGNHTTISVSASGGNFELNVYKPVIIYNILQSMNLLKDSMKMFATKFIDGLELNNTNIKKHNEASLADVTLLNPIIGYDKSALIAKYAYKNHKSLRDSAYELGILGYEEFDEILS